jgi:replication factor A1
LAFITVKYGVAPDTFFYALLSAAETGRAKCRSLLIERRSKTADKIFFLIKEGSDVVAQLPVSKEFLMEQGNPLMKHMGSRLVNRYESGGAERGSSCLIGDLRSGMTHVKLEAEVLEVTEPTYVGTRYGNRVSLAKALIADETGEIKLCLWGEQIASVSVGDQIQIENSRVTKFRGEKQLSLGRKGTLQHIEIEKAEPQALISEKPECQIIN